jgi:hypothetical protein
MGRTDLTSVSAAVDPSRDGELVDGFEWPAALVLFERVGAEHAHEVFTVVASRTA